MFHGLYALNVYIPPVLRIDQLIMRANLVLDITKYTSKIPHILDIKVRNLFLLQS